MADPQNPPLDRPAPMTDVEHDLHIIGDYLSHVDGHDLTHWNEVDGKTVGADEGTTDASEALAALERIAATLGVEL